MVFVTVRNSSSHGTTTTGTPYSAAITDESLSDACRIQEKQEPEKASSVHDSEQGSGSELHRPLGSLLHLAAELNGLATAEHRTIILQ